MLGCTSLSSINVNFTDWNTANNSTTDWVKNINNTSACVFTCPSGLVIYRGDSYIPSNWTINRKALPLCFTALENNCIIQIFKTGIPNPIQLYYNINNSRNYIVNIGVTKITLDKGLFVKFRNIENIFSLDTANYYYFKITGKVSATGNINSLINYSKLTDFCYYRLFSYCHGLITAPELPATLLAQYCYFRMFARLFWFNYCT